MGRIEHRRRRGPAARGTGLRRLPVVGVVFVALAALVAVLELWPIVTELSLGTTTWPGEIPQLLPGAARAAAMVLLPAAVAWGSPTRYRVNGWLWKGALIVAVIQVLRYPLDAARDAILGALVEGGAELNDPVPMLVNVGVGLGLAALSILGVWALGEGLKDAGGRSRVAVVVAGVLAVSLGLLLLVPAFMAGTVTLTLALVPDLLSVLLNVLYVFANALLAGRAIAGALRGVRPALAWRVGAIGGAVVFLVPVLSLALLLLNSYVLTDGTPLSFSFLGVMTCLGWPLVALALAMGMGRIAAPTPSLVGSGFVMRGRAHFAPASPS